MQTKPLENINIIIIGLGYVGLPLAVEFGKKYPTLGFDINQKRIEELTTGYDRTRELSKEQIEEAKLLTFTTDLTTNSLSDIPPLINEGNFEGIDKRLTTDSSSAIPPLGARGLYIITVPTPIDQFKKPDLTPLISASKTVGKVLKKGDVVIYESTVYPGCTEEDCVPILEKESGLKFNEDFFCGYSPERINPGDKERKLTTIVKITSGSTPAIADFVDDLYNSILENGTFKAASIKVAEAAKLIENCQRDVNISFVNELALIFDRMDIDTTDVLDAAGSKWNFLPFKPGLVGGHCIGVDPYYMIHKAESLGYFPALIGAGRRINDNMGIFVANKVIKLMIQKGIQIKGANALILGFTFKENCPDVRNTRVIDIYEELMQFGLEVDVYDPWADKDEVKHEYGVEINNVLNITYDAIVLSVGHKEFINLDYKKIKKSNDSIIYDIKSVLNSVNISERL